MIQVSAFFIFLLRTYQRLLSPFLGNSCRFYPSCSEFAVEAIQQHGCIKGSGYTVWRLLRCHPWHPGGVDWVPLAKNEKNKAL